MSSESFKRKLTAILSADVKGYSRLMGENEAETVKTLTAYRKIMGELIQQHRGRVIDSPGDNILAEFASVVDAVQCSVAAQNEFKARNAELSENRRMVFRIGVNLGDVIEEEGRIYGDGVNIAARLEALADAGGICISKTAFDHIETKLPLGYEYLGEQTVKNIAKPVGAFKVLMEPRVTGAKGKTQPRGVSIWRHNALLSGALALVVVIIGIVVWNFYLRAPKIEPASKEKMALPLPDLPSIAVLPFVNMSDDPKQEFFSDAITENIITALSKVPRLLVIARNSTFTYKGKPVKVKQVSEELGVQHVLEGSVQKSADRIRITAQLIDALKGHHLWAEHYDRELKDLFALQDEITIKIITAIQVKLTAGETAQLLGKKTQNLQAYLRVLEAREFFYTITKEGFAQSRRLSEEAIALDPEYAMAYLYVGSAHLMDVRMGSSKSPEESLKLASEFIKKAIALDDSDSTAHSLLGYLYVSTKQYDKGISECERAIVLAPNSSTANIWMAFALTLAGRHEEAVRYAEQALRLDPFPPGWYFRALGEAYAWVNRYEEAITAHKKALQRAPNDIITHLALTTAYSWAGRLEEARSQGAEVLRINPNYFLEEAEKRSIYKNKADQERYFEDLRKAGLPDKPRLPLPDKPSIAVLPFVNMGGDPKQEFFADGLAEEIINGLTKVPQVFVIARNSSFTYKGKTVDVKQVGREMGVKYVLEGSVRREGDRVRITAQLVDAASGNHIFSERYDRELKDIFALQDEITMKVLTAMRVKWAYGEHERAMARGTKNLEAYFKMLQGWEYCQIVNKESQALARQMAEEAIALDSGYAQAYRLLAQAIVYEVALGSYQHREEALSKAMEMAQKAVSLDDTLAGAHATLGYISLLWKRDYGKAIAEAERAVALEPNSAEAYFSLGSYLFWSGRFEEGIGYLKKALSFSPIEPARYLNLLAHSHAAIGQYEEAISLYKKIIQNHPNHRNAQVGLVCAYVFSGREEEARIQAKEILRIEPKFTVQGFMETTALLYKDQAFAEKFRNEPLRKAGLK
jgi:adenylate cyclase